ncbi:MAG: hypothetical protein QOK42_673 [Frankiaceae bacterium]|jgi:GNAT superfamily N-acetyltransferase|nr:hypothetical protein [Frankiaceae bacterium]
MMTSRKPAPSSLVVNGVPLTIRPIAGEDTVRLMTLHAGLSERTVYQRFFGVLPQLSVGQAERFTHVDGVDRVALVAEAAAGHLVAVGRYDRLPPDGHAAEIAVVVADDYQHHGLGTLLVTMLRSHAHAAGVTEFVAEVLSDNRDMQDAFARAGLVSRTTHDHGVAHLVMPLS